MSLRSAAARMGSADIYRVHLDDSGLQRLTDDPAYDDQPALSRGCVTHNSPQTCRTGDLRAVLGAAREVVGGGVAP